MYKITSVSDKEKMMQFFDNNKLDSLNVEGYVKNNPNIDCILVDDINNITGVYVENNRTKDTRSVYYVGSKEFMAELIDNHFKKANAYFVFCGVKEDIADFVQQYGCSKHWENPCCLFYYPEKTIDLSDIDKDNISQIRIQDVKKINRYYTYRGVGSYARLLHDIKSRPSSGYFVGDRIVSWSLIHDDNSMGVMYTLKTFRRKKLAIQVSKFLIKQVIDKGDIPFVHIVNDNTASLKLAPFCGFKYAYNVSWFGMNFKTENQDQKPVY